ncbi:PREDICTED: 70 kDa peptidyl-prolyl isomerase-like [Nelumbo nucifera]|uniref:peptidylprolyl isomerase n=1 Tax=Nelumbo nucifera TaxID=4432 RepID=A0A1U7ZB20_NELNU|nr:PREDICTED: 70 kDa peptidyl-prolyl isomerase-like [Nelumbo nucifera]
MAVSSFKSSSKAELPYSLEREIGTQGLRKRIIQQGSSWLTPFPGDEVEVHYSGRVEGGLDFDSSRDRGTPFRFKLGQGEVIKGWDDGVATMRKGERAIFTIPPELAYGEMVSPPMIPPNSTLIFDVEMLSWSSVRDLSGDGGILKKIIKEGEGWSTPKDADEVLVKYEARLEDGTLISKSDDGIEFHLSDGYLCPAIAKAVKTMRKGEKAELSVRFSYGLEHGNGVTKSDCSFPPKSNLSVHLELVSWKSVIDVTDDKKVKKKVIKVGEGYDRPSEGSLAKVVYTGKLEDGTIFESKGSEEPFELMCFEGKIHEGLDRAITTMKKGEKALVTISPDYGFDNAVSKDFPKSATLLYEVELISFTKEKPFWKMETAEKIETCERKKEDGNMLFKNGKFLFASKKYEKEIIFYYLQAVKYIEFDHSFTDEEKSQANALRISCNLNNAACKLKLGEYVEAAGLCTKVLELDPFNVKALYRRSQSYIRTSDLEKAEIDIKKALTVDPNNRDVKLEYKKLKDKAKEYAKYQAEIFGTMFSRMAQLET